jgi:hypothetical protein
MTTCARPTCRHAWWRHYPQEHRESKPPQATASLNRFPRDPCCHCKCPGFIYRLVPTAVAGGMVAKRPNPDLATQIAEA